MSKLEKVLEENAKINNSEAAHDILLSMYQLIPNKSDEISPTISLFYKDKVEIYMWSDLHTEDEFIQEIHSLTKDPELQGITVVNLVHSDSNKKGLLVMTQFRNVMPLCNIYPFNKDDGNLNILEGFPIDSSSLTNPWLSFLFAQGEC